MLGCLPNETIADIISHITAKHLKDVINTSNLLRKIVIQTRQSDLIIHLRKRLLLSSFFHHWNTPVATCLKNSWSHSRPARSDYDRIIFIT